MKDYIGREFTSKDGYNCKIVRDLEENTNTQPSRRTYEVQFEDGTIKVYNYNTLARGIFIKEKVKQESYIGKEFISSDRYKCKIIRDLDENTDIILSKRRYEVQFNDGTLATYKYQTLRVGNFNKSNIIKYIGKEFISRDGYKCKIVRDLDENTDKVPSHRRYEVQFEDGTLVTYHYATLKDCAFRKNIIVNFIGEEFTSSDGYKCKIVRDLDENIDIAPSKRSYEVQFEDGTLATYKYQTLKQGRFRKKLITYKGREFTSEDGYKCKIVKDLDESSNLPLNKRRYEIQFEDSTLVTYHYGTLKIGKFKKSSIINYIDKEFISRDGYKCKIVRDLEKDTDKMPSKRRYEVQFENGILAIYNYVTLKKGIFKTPKYFKTIIDKETGYKLNECVLCKLALIMPLDARVLHLRIHHGINVDKDSELV